MKDSRIYNGKKKVTLGDCEDVIDVLVKKHSQYRKRNFSMAFHVSVRIKTKMGVAFEIGDFGWGREDDEGRGWDVYSVRNGIITLIGYDKAEYLPFFKPVKGKNW